ncbi:MAG: ATP-binding protein [Candidatus Methanomethylicia archaeon]
MKVAFGVKVLFDPRPKRLKKDIYDFDDEFHRLRNAIGQPLILVSGLRRTGKTSLVLSVLEDCNVPYMYVDLRSTIGSRRDLYSFISSGVSELLAWGSRWKSFQETILKFLRVVRGVSISGFNVELSWGRDRPLLTELFTILNDAAYEHNSKIVVVFDEIQNAFGIVGRILQNAMAYAYDHLRNLSFIISGSEMGVLYGFLKDPKAPLFGRAYFEVKTRRLRREEAIDFLIKGFEEYGVEPPKSEIEEVVNMFNGIIGWLTYYGYSKCFGGRSYRDIWNDAIELARLELENFLRFRVSRSRYIVILRALAQGVVEWGKLKRFLEDIEGRGVSDRVLHDILITLRRHSIIDEDNKFMDPLIKEAAKRL